MTGRLHGAIEFLEKIEREGLEALSGDDVYYVIFHLDAVRRAAETIEYMARISAGEYYDNLSRADAHFAARNRDKKAWVTSRWLDFVEPAVNDDLFKPKEYI
jgi:hypothetical protein